MKILQIIELMAFGMTAFFTYKQEWEIATFCVIIAIYYNIIQR